MNRRIIGLVVVFVLVVLSLFLLMILGSAENDDQQLKEMEGIFAMFPSTGMIYSFDPYNGVFAFDFGKHGGGTLHSFDTSRLGSIRLLCSNRCVAEFFSTDEHPNQSIVVLDVKRGMTCTTDGLEFVLCADDSETDSAQAVKVFTRTNNYLLAMRYAFATSNDIYLIDLDGVMYKIPVRDFNPVSFVEAQ